MMSIFDPFQTGRRLSALCTGQASRRPVCLSDIVYIYYMHSIYEEHTLVKRGPCSRKKYFPTFRLEGLTLLFLFTIIKHYPGPVRFRRGVGQYFIFERGSPK